MWFLPGDKFNGSNICDIIGQHEDLKVSFEVIRVSNAALGAERSTFMTHRVYINHLLNTSSISCNAIVVVNSQHRVC